MSIGNRIKQIRNAVDKTQQSFADDIGLKRNTIANYEIGNVVPSDRTISDICREFHVNENWLRTGEGEMFTAVTRKEEIASFVGNVLSGTSEDFKVRFIAALAELNEDQWKLIEDMIEKLSGNKKE